MLLLLGFVFLFRCRRGQLFVSLNSYTIRAILVLVRVWGLGSAPSVPLHTPLGFMPEPVWQKRSANRHRRSAKFGAVYGSDSQQSVRQNRHQKFAQCAPLKWSSGQTEQGCDLWSVKSTRCDALHHVAGPVLAPEPPQGRVPAQFFKRTS